MTFAGNASLCGQWPNHPSLFKFQSQVPSHNPRAVKCYCPLVLAADCKPLGTDASGCLVCLAFGPSSATTSTWPGFSPVEGYNSPKVAAGTIVYATVYYCQVKGKKSKTVEGNKGLLPAEISFSLCTHSETF